MVGDDLIIIIPVLGRPHRVEPVLESALEATPGQPRVVFVPDPWDEEEIGAIENVGAEFKLVEGNYARKINTVVNMTDEEWIFLGADDLKFHPHWFENAVARQDIGIGVIGTYDMCNPRVLAGKHATHSLVTRWYADKGTIDDPSRLLHEAYLHEMVDDEFVETAKYRKAWTFARDSVVQHLHPMVGLARVDDVYADQPRRIIKGRKIYNQRKHLWQH